MDEMGSRDSSENRPEGMPTAEDLLALGISPSEVEFYLLVAAGNAPANPHPYDEEQFPQFKRFLSSQPQAEHDSTED